jgi:hypothetical protein
MMRQQTMLRCCTNVVFSIVTHAKLDYSALVSLYCLTSLIKTETMEEDVVRKRQKRKRRHGDKPDKSFTEHSTVKVSLSHILKLNTLRPRVIELVHVVNQLRVLVSYVWKTHMIMVHEQGLVPPRIDQNYLCAIGTQLKGGTSKKALPPLLTEALHLIKSRFNAPHTDLPAGAITQCLQYAARSMLTNWQVFQKVHAETSLNCWLNNQLRVLCPREKGDATKQKQIKAYLKNVNENTFLDTFEGPKPELYQLRLRYWKHAHALKGMVKECKEEDDEDKEPKMNHQAVLSWLFLLKKETEALSLPLDQVKCISILPEKQICASYVTIDSVVLITLLKQTLNRKGSVTTLAGPDTAPAFWWEAFHEKRVESLRATFKFNWHIVTDGVAASVAFLRYTPQASTYKHSKKLRDHFQVGSFYASQVSAKLSKGVNDLVAIDPGKCTLLACSNLGTDEVHRVEQRRYQEESGMRWFQAYRRKLEAVGGGRQFMQALTALPGAKTSSSLSRWLLYLDCIQQHWSARWRLVLQRSFLKKRWKKEQQRQRFMDRVVDEVAGTTETPMENRPILLFGRGGEIGGFVKVRGGGVCGPVVELRKRLQRRTMVILCSEYRTSKCCLHCGGPMAHPSYASRGVSFCSKACTGVSRKLYNRDVQAAVTIGARFLAEKSGHELGIFSSAVKWEDRDAAPRTGLCDALIQYRQQ